MTAAKSPLTAPALHWARHQRGLTSRRQLQRGKVLLVVGMLIALLTDGIGSTMLGLARSEINGHLATTPDEVAWLSIVYLAAKIVGFLVAPWCCGRLGTREAMTVAIRLMVTLFCFSTLANTWILQMAIFIGLGLAGAVMLVAAQALLFQTFTRPNQPGLQLLYAMGSAAGAAAFAPGIQGWVLDQYDWRWIVATAIGAGVLALALLRMTRIGERAISRLVRFDGVMVGFAAIATVCLAYLATQGERWNWFEESRIIGAVVVGAGCTVLAARRAIRQSADTCMLDLSIYRNLNFSFAFLASFVAGFALFGTAYLIPAYASTGLGMSTRQVGILLLPGAASFALAMGISAYVLPRLKVPPVLTVPAGIVLLIAATWLLGHQARGTGVAELLPAVLLRGSGLGFLFLAITLLALMWMPGPQIPHGSALMAVARQIGGLAGTGFLGSIVMRHTERNSQMLSAHLVEGEPGLNERIYAIAARLARDGLHAADATTAAVGQVAQQLAAQAQAVAWNRAFLTVTVFFLLAAPMLITLRLILLRVLGPPPAPPKPAIKQSV